jgi:hypothetical protein
MFEHRRNWVVRQPFFTTAGEKIAWFSRVVEGRFHEGAPTTRMRLARLSRLMWDYHCARTRVSAPHGLASVGFIHGADGLDEGADLDGIFFTGLEFDPGGDVDSPGVQNVDRVLHVAGMEASGNDELADAVDDAGPGLNALPIECAAGASGGGGSGGVEQHARNHAGTEAVGLEEKVAVFSDMNLLNALAFVGFIGFDETDVHGIPSDGFVSRLVEDLSGKRAEDRGAGGAVGKSLEKGEGEFLIFAAVQLHGGESDELCGFTDAVDGRVDEDSNFFKRGRELGGDGLGGLGSDEARAPLIEDEAYGVGAGISGGERVVEVGDPADLDPSHKSSDQLSAISFQEN